MVSEYRPHREIGGVFLLFVLYRKDTTRTLGDIKLEKSIWGRKTFLVLFYYKKKLKKNHTFFVIIGVLCLYLY